MDWFLKLLLPDLSDRNERDSGSGSGFHLPSRQVEFPAGVRTEYAVVWFFCRDRDCNPDSRALGETPGPRPGTVPRSGAAWRTPVTRATRRAYYTEVRTNAVNSPAFACISPGHLVSRSYRPRHLYPSIADGSDLLSRSTYTYLVPWPFVSRQLKILLIFKRNGL